MSARGNNYKALEFRWGPFSFEFEPWSGWIRNVCVGKEEVVRAIYGAARDENWGTPAIEITDVEFDVNSHRLAWEGVCREEATPYTIRGVAYLEEGQCLVIHLFITPDSEFLTQRTGLCLLHPAELAGRKCEVVTVYDEVQAGAFPDRVKPDTVFTGVKGIAHLTEAGEAVGVILEGETFEMEDQRNWSDASFKTYCRPLQWPRPYLLNEGQTITHTCRITTNGDEAPLHKVPPVLVRFGSGDSFPFPRLGWMADANFVPPRTFAFKVPNPYADSTLWSISGLEKSGPVEVTPLSSPEAEVGGVLVFSSNFTELNRSVFQVEFFEGLGFGIDAQVHAHDDRSIMESLAMQSLLARQATVRAKGKPLHICPVRFAPHRDPRWNTEMARAWWLASVIAICSAGVGSVTYDLPAKVTQDDAWHALFALVGQLDELTWAPLAVSQPYSVSGVALLDAKHLLLINHRPQEVKLELEMNKLDYVWSELTSQGWQLRSPGPIRAYQILWLRRTP
ncbi:MAG: hypothetical protein MUC92_11375 [Fimbriimonadaceae bacterium]|jgi:hypothetical protein|nr:hypothetical protein [Fimbriimonadaceae bacterium]